MSRASRQVGQFPRHSLLRRPRADPGRRHRGDQYALGCLLYRVPHRRAAVPRGEVQAIIGAHLAARRPRPPMPCPLLPPAIDAVIAEGMAKDPTAATTAAASRRPGMQAGRPADGTSRHRRPARHPGTAAAGRP